MKKFFVFLSLCIVILHAHGSLPFDLEQEAPALSCQASPTDSPVAQAAEQPGQEGLAKKLLAALAGQDLAAYTGLNMEALPEETLKAVMLETLSPPLSDDYVKHTAKRREITEAQAREKIQEYREREKSRLERGYAEHMKGMPARRKSGFEQLLADSKQEAGIDWRKVAFVKMDGGVFQSGEAIGGDFDLVFSHGAGQFKLFLDNCIFLPAHGWLLGKDPRWAGAYVPFSRNLGGVRLSINELHHADAGDPAGEAGGAERDSRRYQVSFSEKADAYSLAEWTAGAWKPVQKGKTEFRRSTVSLLPDGPGDLLSLSFSNDQPEKGQMVRFFTHDEVIVFVRASHLMFEVTEIVRGINDLGDSKLVPGAGKPAGVQLVQQDVFGGNFQEVKRKLEQGADPNIILLPKAKKSALHCCCMAGRVNLVKLLLSKGANPNALDNSKMTPLDVLFSPDFKGRSPLERMTAEKQLEIKTMLEKAGGKRNRL